MSKNLSFALVVGILLLLGSYASSEKGKHYNGVYTARENNDYTIKKVCFIFDSNNLSEKYEYEQFFANQAIEFDIEAISGEKLFPSIKQYTNEEIVSKIQSNHCDSLIICSLEGSESFDRGYSVYNLGYGNAAIVKNRDKTKILLNFVLVEIPSNKRIAVTSVDIIGGNNRKINHLAMLRFLREYKYLGIIK